MAPTSPGVNEPIVVSQEVKKPLKKSKKTAVKIVEEKLQEVNVPHVQVAKTKEDEYKEMQDFLANPDNKQKAVHLADQIQKLVGKNWFSMRALLSKTKENQWSAYQKLQLCKMFGMAETKIGDYRDGKQNLRVQLFKITIGPEERIKAIDDVIGYHQGQIETLQRERDSLSAKLKPAETQA